MSILQIINEFSARHPEAPIAVAIGPSGTIVALAGSFDMRISTEVEVLLAAVVDLAEIDRPLILDLSAVGYVSSTGVGALVTTLARARRRNLPLFLRNMTPKVSSVFELLGFLQFFPRDGADAKNA
jgi:anti-anti-sigma factor